MERPPEFRKDEQYPLLKVASGIKDTRQTPPVETQSWTVSCEPKQSRLNRWFEVATASWMTLVLLAMSFLVFYTVSTGAYRRPLILAKYDETRPSSNVFLHHIIHRGCTLPFALYTHFLHAMAVTYPKLRFNVFFLVDDAMRNAYYIPRHARLLGFHGKEARDEVVNQEIRDLERKHPNVNVTIMDLNKYMAMTPLKLKWRIIPVSYLSFYIRIFSVWQYGGIGMDLTTYNNQFCNKIHLERRVTEILKNHNDGLPNTDYKSVLRAIDEDEKNCFKSLEQMWNDTLSIFNSVFSFGFPSQISDLSIDGPLDIKPAIRSQRTNRDVSNFYEIVTSEGSSSTDNNVLNLGRRLLADEQDNGTKINETIDDDKIIKISPTEFNSTNDQLKTEVPQPTSEQSSLTSTTITFKVEDAESNKTVWWNKSNNNPETPSAVWFYDFSIMSDNVGRVLPNEPLWSSFMPRQSFGLRSVPVKYIDKKEDTNAAEHLALASDGDFIAATEKLHPFLGMLMTADLTRMRPEYAIKHTILSQCSGMYKNEPFCNIYAF